MSDESSDEDKINKRTLPWRSQDINHLCFCPTLFTLAALNKLIGKLNKRMDRATNCYIRRKERLQKSPSKLPPPKEAPSWAISSNKSSQCARAKYRYWWNCKYRSFKKA